MRLRGDYMENISKIKYNKEALVVQANELIRSKQDELTLMEAKIIRLAIAQIIETDIELRTFSCNVTELAKHLGISSENIYRDVELFARGITKKSIYVVDKNSPKKKNGKPNYEIFPWVDYFRYRDGEITIRLSDKLKPLLIGLSEHFTQYGYSNIISLPSTNSIRLLELLTSYESLVNLDNNYKSYSPYSHIEKADNEIIFTIEYLKEFFNCVDKYAENKDFIKRVIAASVKAINEKSTTHKVSYRTAKEGRKIGYVLFKINAWNDKDFIDFLANSITY